MKVIANPRNEVHTSSPSATRKLGILEGTLIRDQISTSHESNKLSQANKPFARTALHPPLFGSCAVVFPSNSIQWDQMLVVDPMKRNH